MKNRAVGARFRSGAQVALTVIAISGCATAPGKKAPVFPPPDPASLPDSLPSVYMEEVGPADTLRMDPAPPRVVERPPRRTVEPDTLAATAEAPQVEPVPSMSIQISSVERARLTDEANRDIAVTNTCLHQVQGRVLSPERRQSLADVEDLLRSVAKAREEDDVQAAARLARKARILAEELIGN